LNLAAGPLSEFERDGLESHQHGDSTTATRPLG
jgi:hypothetical protein